MWLRILLTGLLSVYLIGLAFFWKRARKTSAVPDVAFLPVIAISVFLYVFIWIANR